MGGPCASIEVAQGWVEALEESDLNEVMRLYAPRATLHLPGKALWGRARVREYLQAKSWSVPPSRDPEQRSGSHPLA